MKFVAFLVLPLALTACVMPEVRVQPVGARINDQMLTVNFSDGQTCRADWAAAPKGRLEACAFDYEVLPEVKPNILHDLLRGVNDEVEGTLIVPLAQIILHDAQGRSYKFSSTTPIKDYDYWNEQSDRN